MPVRRLVIALLVLGGVSLGVHTQFSSAAYTSATNTESTVTATNDWTPPTVSITSPGATISGTTTISATAADSRSAVASVVIEYSLANAGSWTTICTDTVSPYSCSWNTTAVTDGDYQLRARATDTAGISASSDLAATEVVNSTNVVMSEHTGYVRGTVPLSASVVNLGGGAVASLKIQYRNTAGTWVDICSNYVSSTLSCSWVTPAGAGDYEVRAVANVGFTSYTDTVTYKVDNVVPTSTVTVPTGTLFDTVPLGATATDADSGVAAVLFDYRRTDASAWTTCGTDSTAPYGCDVDNTGLRNGSNEFR
jgi:chitinase